METTDRYLITGSSGFIGRHLVDSLSEKDIRVRCLVTSPKHKSLWKLPNVEAVEGNLLDAESLDKALVGADICVHLASVINSRDVRDFERVNIKGMRNIVDASRRKKVRKFIYVSSIDAEVNPDSLYGSTKLIAERILKESPLRFTVLRPSVVYGAYDNKNIMSLINLARFLPIVPIIGDGEYKRQPLYIDDLVSVIYQCACLEKTDGKTYNIGGPSALSMNAIMRSIQEALGRERPMFYIPSEKLKFIASVLGKWNGVIAKHMQQILSVDKDKLFDIKGSVEEFGFSPTEFDDGIKIMLKEMGING